MCVCYLLSVIDCSSLWRVCRGLGVGSSWVVVVCGVLCVVRGLMFVVCRIVARYLAYGIRCVLRDVCC